MFMRSAKLSATTKLSAEHETPPIANLLLAPVFCLSLRSVITLSSDKGHTNNLDFVHFSVSQIPINIPNPNEIAVSPKKLRV